MTSFNENAHPRATNGTFKDKTNTAPRGQLLEVLPIDVTPANTRYTLLVNDRPYASREPGADKITVHDALPGMPQIAGGDLGLLAVGAPASDGTNWKIRAEGVNCDGGVEVSTDVDVPAEGQLLVCSHMGDFMTISDLDERGLSLIDVDTHADKLIELPDDEDDEPVDLEDVRRDLSGDGNPVSMVTIRRKPNDRYTAEIDVTVHDNLMWNSLFTEDELNEHASVVDEVYGEWFNAEVEVPDDWSSVSVTLRSEIDVARATPLLVLDRAWGSHSKFINETDPGTFMSPYVGAEIRRRIDARIEAAAEAEEMEGVAR